MHEISLLIVQTFDDDGTNATTMKPIATLEEIVERVEFASRVFAVADVQLLFDPARDVLRINNSLLNRSFVPLVPPDVGTDGWSLANWPEPGPPSDIERRKLAKSRFAQLFHGRVVVFLRPIKQWKLVDKVWRIRNAKNSSGGRGEYINLHTNGAPVITLAHELGHYLQNRHTFTEVETLSAIRAKVKEYVDGGRPKEDGLDILDWDRHWVRDTPPDAGPDVFEALNIEKCGTATVDFDVTFADNSKQSYSLDPDRTNLMNYFGCTNEDDLRTLTADQITRLRDGLETGFRHALITPRPPSHGRLTLLKETVDEQFRAAEIAMLADKRMIVAGINLESRLIVTEWNYLEAGAGNLVKRHSGAPTGEVKRVSLCALGLGIIATCVVTAANKGKIILWEARPNGTMERRGSEVIQGDGEVEDIACCRLGYEYLATFVRLNNGDSQIDIWEVLSSGELKNRYSSRNTVSGILDVEGGNGIQPSIGLHSVDTHGVAALARDESFELGFTVGRFEGSDQLPGPGGVFEDIRNPKGIKACGLDGLTGASVIINEDGRLRIDALSYERIGYGYDPQNLEYKRVEYRVIKRAMAETSGQVKGFSACRVGTQMLATPIINSADRLKVIVWEVTPQGYHIRRLADAVSVPVSTVSCCHAGENLFAVAARSGRFEDDRRLLIQMWRVE